MRGLDRTFSHPQAARGHQSAFESAIRLWEAGRSRHPWACHEEQRTVSSLRPVWYTMRQWYLNDDIKEILIYCMI